MGASGLRIGFACHWDRPAASTWSYTPWHLRTALGGHANLVDLGVQLPSAVRFGLKVVNTRWRQGGLRSSWRQSALTDAIVGRTLRAAEDRCDVVLQIQDLARFQRPYSIYQDLSYDLLVNLADNPGVKEQFAALSPSTISRRQDRQGEVYDGAASILAMSHWFARSLVDHSGLPASRVRVVNPGANARPTEAELTQVLKQHTEPSSRILFVGRDFVRKGGDLVVDAVRTLRQHYSPAVRLSVVGPPAWPLPGEPPSGVEFLGSLDVTEVRRLFASHDVYAMPSRFEAFGIVFAEALTWGMPCVARRAYAMPEIIKDGENGALVGPDATSADIADAIVRILEDEELRKRTRSGARSAWEHYTWDRAALEVLEAIDP